MKYLATIMFFIALLLITATAIAQIQYYDIDTFVNENGKATIQLKITYVKPETNFSFYIFGKAENFIAKSIAGPINCDVKVDDISAIRCYANLTQEKRTVEISFETNDFVKSAENLFFFDGDFSLSNNIKEVFASIKLSENFRLYSEDVTTAKVSFPENASILTTGRTIIINWKLKDIKASQPLRFQFLYEEVQPVPLFSVRLRYFLFLGVGAVAVIVFVIYWYKKRPEKIVLSVLDEFERKVVEVISAHGGETNQKKVVQETNLSKAKVSRVVKSLEERGLVEVEHLGRTNKLKLVKKKLKM